MSTRVLVTGASIAGPAVAYWLAEAGFEVTVLERAAVLREGGQNIDVRATGREVIRRMGLEEAVRGRNTGEVGTRFVNEAGTVISEFPVSEGGSDGPTAELEILRGALSHLLVDACPSSVKWRFGDEITAIEQDEKGADVTFGSGERERFDLVVVAEGAGSRTRQLVFGDEPEERELGMYVTYGTIEREPQDDNWWRVLVAPEARQISLRPDDEGTMRAMLNFRADTPVLEGLSGYTVRRELCKKFADLGWEVPRILDGFEVADDLYVEWLRQIVSPTWHKGRVCLLGDAAWCVTPIAGGGTSLALTGAYVLAAFLSQGEPAEAFARYEEWMRPLVEDAQNLPPGVPRIAAPESRAGVQALRWGTKVAALPLVRTLTTRLTAGPGADQELPQLDRH
ncbi:FAD-dependent monooxygenase [Actinoplanes sp. Pm04-4]|uniref:FAD-dependent monooxygenase n=1 Tax=Paractinoplanes pyxinae TaxID=2997416 RepID=A0ABT4AXQ4_9ACTN|nr:FAD-dependent monooxygenase [Actinoplanes pyxinae]MCY1139022.1 FAD-dependent monooxygenase [Actinoplanes pyxinae]